MECAIVAHSGSGAFNGCMVKAGQTFADTGDHHWRWPLFYSKRITGLPLILLACLEAPAICASKIPCRGAAIPGLPYMFQLAGYSWTAPDLERFCQDGNWELNIREFTGTSTLRFPQCLLESGLYIRGVQMATEYCSCFSYNLLPFRDEQPRRVRRTRSSAPQSWPNP